MEIQNGYIPHAKQLPFHNSKAKFRAIISGVGFGKSAALVNDLLKTAIKYPKCIHLILTPNSKIMNFATLIQFWKFCPPELILAHRKSERMIYLVGGARILYLTADNQRHIERVRGIELGSWWLDEGALLLRMIFDILIGRLRDPNGPLTGVLTTTPAGYKWYNDYFVMKRHPVTKEPLKRPKDYEWFSGSTLDNPFTPEEYKQTLLNTYAGKFREQEIFGKIVGFEGMVFLNFNHRIHILEHTNRRKYKQVIAGLDIGFSNPMASLIIGIDGDDRAYVLEEYYRKMMPIENVGEWLKLKVKEYDITNIYADPSEPMVINQLNNMGLPVQRARNEVMPGINFVYSMFEIQKDGRPRLYIHQQCSNLIEEINNYRYAEEKENKEHKENPLKVNDHLCDCARYALFSHLGSRGEFILLEDKEGVFL